ncbi:MAG TPA: hypothetical protein VL361_02435 [Candidatus Limnocylindrales bacterium]|nr:hypothetical protein [Candidatus Limnocylindrales bacterium]
MNSVPKSFLRWQPVALSLIALTVIYWAFALLNFPVARVMQQRGDTRNAHFLVWGVFWNLVVGGLCLSGWRLMKTASRGGYIAGAFAVGAALLIVMRSWLSALLTGRNPFPFLEALFIWPWLIYALIYAVRELQKQGNAKPGAAPNQGPATPPGDSGPAEGPPSVS